MICILWITIFLSMYHAQPPLPEAAGCDCDCMACSTCDFENSCMTVTANGDGDVLMDDIGNCVIVESVISNNILGTNNNDCILVRGSAAAVGSVTARGGNDCILIQDEATVLGLINAGNDDDCVRVTQSTASTIRASSGDDDIIIEGSNLQEMSKRGGMSERYG